MNNEIKEILDRLKDIDKTSILKNNDAKILLDYITNLQSEVKSGNNIILAHKNRIKEFKKEITNLQQQNENLKELCDKYEEEHSNEFQCWKRDRTELLDNRARIEKAVEYINTGIGKSLKEEYCCFGILLNILNGRSDE